ncbi:hypothetical protein DFH06DRAFT_1330922 [Mycena polygramma]|nr:hypothetical protein DFH06DRAFT_1330922 [Mycena polygramma]
MRDPETVRSCYLHLLSAPHSHSALPTRTPRNRYVDAETPHRGACAGGAHVHTAPSPRCTRRCTQGARRILSHPPSPNQRIQAVARAGRADVALTSSSSTPRTATHLRKDSAQDDARDQGKPYAIRAVASLADRDGVRANGATAESAGENEAGSIDERDPEGIPSATYAEARRTWGTRARPGGQTCGRHPPSLPRDPPERAGDGTAPQRDEPSEAKRTTDIRGTLRPAGHREAAEPDAQRNVEDNTKSAQSGDGVR